MDPLVEHLKSLCREQPTRVRDIVAPGFTHVPSAYRRAMAQADMWRMAEIDEDLVGKSGPALYDALGPLRTACLLNLAWKAGHPSSARISRYIRALHLLRQDRCFATVDPGHVWLAPLDVVLDHEAPVVLQPDLFVILETGKARVADHVYGAPDLVIEVLSPWPRIGDLATRIALFRDHGVRECWLVHQLTGVVEVLTFEDRQIASRTVHARHERIVSTVLPGFDRSLSMMLGYEM